MRPAPVWLRPASALALALAFAAPVAGQAPPADPLPLAGYVPKEDLAFLLEFDGIDAHADAWRKTAASRILNDTPAGDMIGSVLGQWITGALKIDGNRAIGLAKHALHAGFVVGVTGKPDSPKPSVVVIVLRKGFSNRDVKPMAAQLLNAANAPDTKPAAVTTLGHKVYRGKTRGGDTFSWWVEETKKEDIVFVLPAPESADAVIETLEGKRPNAVDLPARAELRNTAEGFEPFGYAFLDTARFNGGAANIKLEGVKQVDFRWGVQGDALQTVARVAVPGPRQGALGLLDGPSFDKATFPPIPDAATGFGVMALDLKAAFDQVTALADALPPPLSGPIRSTLDSLQKGKVKFRDDVLGHMGPKVAFYGLPAKPGDAPPASAATAMLSMMGMNTAIRGAAIFEIDDPVKFGRSLDELMVVVNREIKASFAAAAPAPPDDPNAPPRDRRAPVPSPEFRLSPSQPKSYIFSVPPELTKTFPPSFRPSVRVGPKHVVIATTADVAREALEPKGLWSAPAELGDAFATLPGQLKWIQLGDNRDAIAATLATFPAKVQILANSPLLRGSAGAVAANPGANPAAPPGSSSGSSSSGSSSSSSSGPAMQGRSLSMNGMPGASPTGPMLPPGSSSGAPGGAAPAAGAGVGGSAPIVIQVPPGKLPGADTVKGMMFPSLFYVVSSPEEIRVVSRVAFPDISGLALAPAASMIAAGGAPGLAPTPPPGGPNGPGPVGPGPVGPGGSSGRMMPGRPAMPGAGSSSGSGDSTSPR